MKRLAGMSVNGHPVEHPLLHSNAALLHIARSHGHPHGMKNTSPSFPLNFRTAVFCFLMGAVLSFPCGMIWEATARPFNPPLWTIPYYLGTVFSSFVILPFWSVYALRGVPVLRFIGFWTPVGLILLASIASCLFPAR